MDVFVKSIIFTELIECSFLLYFAHLFEFFRFHLLAGLNATATPLSPQIIGIRTWYMAMEHTVFSATALEDGEDVPKWLEVVVTCKHNFLFLLWYR
jgi:hypothetical protein